MVTIEERNEKFYTQAGLTALNNRLDSFIEVFNQNNFPFEAKMLGFGDFSFMTRNDCKQRINELSKLIGRDLSIEFSRKKQNDSIITEEKING